MKRVIWIYSVNIDGGPPFGYGANTVGKVEKFMKKIATELLPEVKVQFISYDTTRNHVPLADLIVFNDLDARYLADDIKKGGLCIPYKDLYRGDSALIKNAITASLK